MSNSKLLRPRPRGLAREGARRVAALALIAGALGASAALAGGGTVTTADCPYGLSASQCAKLRSQWSASAPSTSTSPTSPRSPQPTGPAPRVGDMRYIPGPACQEMDRGCDTPRPDLRGQRLDLPRNAFDPALPAPSRQRPQYPDRRP